MLNDFLYISSSIWNVKTFTNDITIVKTQFQWLTHCHISIFRHDQMLIQYYQKTSIIGRTMLPFSRKDEYLYQVPKFDFERSDVKNFMNELNKTVDNTSSSFFNIAFPAFQWSACVWIKTLTGVSCINDTRLIFSNSLCSPIIALKKKCRKP